jgi:hypothetical protein
MKRRTEAAEKRHANGNTCSAVVLVLDLKQGAVLGLGDIERICRLNLREALWCKLEDEGGQFVHFGWDYYMYIGGADLL